ncbi:MAG: oxidoreductase [Acidobacteria bacterium]|nr:MAG: oxidoreductase [Acidobacteriota bacterium]
MTKKPKVAIYWLGACGGCDEAIVDLNEVLLQVASAVDIVLWPLAMDQKYHSIEELPDGSITLSIIHGNVRNTEHEEMARLLRAKSNLVLAFGTCACFGGTTGLANFCGKESIMQWVYRDAPTVENPKKQSPQPKTTVGGESLTLPELLDHVYSLNQVIPVDYYLPGCPPPPDLIGHAIFAVLEGKLPPRSAVLAPQKALCETCPRNNNKPPRIDITGIKRVYEVEVDSHVCFLTEGVICMGPATRGGCGETCLRINTPCRGCFGPVEGVEDAGAKFLSAFASLVKATTDEQVQVIMEKFHDPAGCLYRFTQPTSTLGKRSKVRETV